MFRTSCGKPVAEGTNFCANCGQPLRVDTATPAPFSVRVEITNPKHGKNLQLVGGLAIVIGLVVGIGACSQDGAAQLAGVIGILVALGGVVLTAIGRFQHWYKAE